MKNIIKMLFAFMLLVIPANVVCAEKFTVDSLEFDTDTVFTDDFDILCAPGDTELSPGGIINSIKEKEAGYWQSSSGNYYLIVNTLYGSQGMSFNILLEDIAYLRPYLIYTGGQIGLCVGNSESPRLTITSAVGEGFSWNKIICNGVGFSNGAYTYIGNYELYNRYEDFGVQIYTNTLNVNSNAVAEAYKICTNIPFFLTQDAADIYLSTGKTDGAANAEQIDNMTNPKDEVSYSNTLKLENIQYYGTYLDMSVIEDKYFSFEYMPECEEYSIDDLYIEAMYQYSYAWSILNQPSKSLSGYKYANYYYPLKDYRNSLKIYPYVVVNDYMGMLPNLSKACCGGSVNGSDVGLQLGDAEITASSIAKISTSILSVNLRLVYKKNQKVVASSRSYTQDVNLLTGDCDFHYSNIDEETDEYKKDENPYKTTDKDGNTKVNNTIDGGNNSSSTGGNASINNTIKFPDHITLDLNVNGIPSNTTQVTVNGGGSSNDAKLPDFVQGAGSGVGDFMKYLFTGFGLFDGNSGIVQFLQANFSYVPHDYWIMYMFAFCGLILVAFIMRFFR